MAMRAIPTKKNARAAPTKITNVIQNGSCFGRKTCRKVVWQILHFPVPSRWRIRLCTCADSPLVEYPTADLSNSKITLSLKERTL